MPKQLLVTGMLQGWWGAWYLQHRFSGYLGIATKKGLERKAAVRLRFFFFWDSLVPIWIEKKKDKLGSFVLVVLTCYLLCCVIKKDCYFFVILSLLLFFSSPSFLCCFLSVSFSFSPLLIISPPFLCCVLSVSFYFLLISISLFFIFMFLYSFYISLFLFLFFFSSWTQRSNYQIKRKHI